MENSEAPRINILTKYFFIQVEPKNHIPISPNWCSKLQDAYKKKYNKFEIPGSWSSSNCYLFYDKSFVNQTEAEKFCRNAFGSHRYIGELAYGIGISNSSLNETAHIQPRWKYLKLGILDDIEAKYILSVWYEMIMVPKISSACKILQNNTIYYFLLISNLTPLHLFGNG